MPAGRLPGPATSGPGALMGGVGPGWVKPSPPVAWSWLLDRPPVNWALRFLTRAFWLTVSGASPWGGDRLRGVPLELASDAVAVSELAVPRMKFPPFAALAIPAPPSRTARVIAMVPAGLNDRRTVRQWRPHRRAAASSVRGAMGSSVKD